jgi:hypothetical protein
VPDSTFESFVNAHGGSPQSLVGETITLYLTDDDLYFDVNFTSYSGGGPGGGFAYTRRQMMPWYSLSNISGSLAPAASIMIDVSFEGSDLAAELHYGNILINSNDPDTPLETVTAELDVLTPGIINILESEIIDTLNTGSSSTFDLTIENTGLADLLWNANNPITFTKADNADFTLEENQDRITDDVWITRGSTQGLFNIAQEASYDRNSRTAPAGTEWALGTTASPGPYGRFYDLRNQISGRFNNLPGTPLSLHLVEEDIYFDLTFSSWTVGNNGGGFSYIRTSAFPYWLDGPVTGTVGGGSSTTYTYTLDATSLNEGTYTYDLEIRSSDVTQPLVVIPITLRVLGTPEITTDAAHDYGDVFNGVAKTYALPIENTGSSTLTVSNIAADSSQFVPVLTTVTLEPGENTTIPIAFTPSYLGFIRDTLRITSNDTANPLIKVVLEGTGIDLPEISLSAYSFNDTLLQDSVSTDTIVMTNTGATDLIWSLSTNSAIAFDETGFLFYFEKGANVNIDLIENRDSITPNVSLTRDGGGGLVDYNGNSIEWAMGSTYEALSMGRPYTSDWRNAMNNQAQSLPGKTISLYIVDEEVYVDINILSWGNRDAGTVYSYTRTAPMPQWLASEGLPSGNNGTLAAGATENIVITHNASGILQNNVYSGAIVIATNVPSQPDVSIATSMTVMGINSELSLDTTNFSATLIADGLTTRDFVISNNGTSNLFYQLSEPEDANASIEKVVFYKSNYADWLMEENQDRITDLVWLTRADNRGIFNIVQESVYDNSNNTSPLGTEWAHGYTMEVSPDDYGTWYKLHNQNTPSIVGKPMSLHLIEEDIYFDLMFTGWQSNSEGGGFSYIRSTPSMPVNWLSASQNQGVVFPGTSKTISLAFDASEMIAGTYNAEIILSSNDTENREVVLTSELEVLGNPEILLPTAAIDFGDGFIGYATDMEFTIENNGNDVLNISDISFSDAAFSVGESNISVPAFDAITLMVSFTPTLEQAYSGTMTITSDDPVNPSLSVTLTGTGVVPPSLSVNVTELSATLFTGEFSSQQFVVTNSGSSVLNWQLRPNLEEITFTKQDYADWNLEENQDRISEDIWLTRQNSEGLYNIAQESSYDRGGAWISPLGTQWAYGTTDEVSGSDYTTWRNAIRNVADIRMNELPGYTFSMRLTDADTYYDVTFHSWTSNGNGGGFSYTRKYISGFVNVNKSWLLLSHQSGSLGAGESDTVTVTFNPNTDISAGSFFFEMAVASNDPNGPVVIPVSLSIDDIVAAEPIADTLVQEGFTGYTKDVSGIFESGSNNPLSYMAESSNEMVASATIAGTTLTITETGTGTSEITIFATSDFGETGSQSFNLRVNAAPVTTPLPDMRYPDGFGTDEIDISNVFTDSDGDVLMISVSNSFDTIITTALNSAMLSITEVGSGVSDVTLNADDGFGGLATTNFEIRVNTPPVVVSPISNISVDENFTTNTIDLSGVFFDSDMDPLTYSATSADQDVVLSFIEDANLVIVEAGTGTSNITVSASDEISSTLATNSFDFTVNPGTGVNEAKSGSLSIYPNPSSGLIKLSTNETYKGEAVVKVFDFKGGQVYTEEFNVFNDDIQLDLTFLNDGVYLIQLSLADAVHYKKLVIEQ